MGERRESVRVSASGSDFDRTFSAIERRALATAAALKAIPNRVRVDADARGLSSIEREAAGARLALRGIPNEIHVRGDASGLSEIERRARRADQSSSALVDTVIALGPALVPIGAVGVPALAGLTAQLGFAAGAAGSALLAFNGVGDALKALNAYQLDPSAANLEKLNETMGALGPAGRDFVRQLDRISPALKSLKVAAENGVLPGVGDALDILITRLPEARNLLSEFSDITGDLARDGAEALAGPKFEAFFSYLQTDARPILTDLGSAFGNLTLGFANMLAGLSPLERDFSGFLADSARDFASWSATFADSEGLAEFVDYVRDAGPRVGETLGAIGGALVSVTKAAAPLGGPSLQILATFADVVDRIASSPLGTPLLAFAAAIATVNRALAVSALAKNNLVTDLIRGKLNADGSRGATALTQIKAQLGGVTAEAKAARVALAEAQAVQTRLSDVARRNAQSGALIPRAQNVQLVRDYRLAQDGVAAASRRVADAEARASASRRQLLGTTAKGAGAVGALALATSGLGDKMGLTNAVSLGLAGSIGGPLGAAIGTGIGLFMDLRQGTDDLTGSIINIQRVLGDSTISFRDQNKALDEFRKGVSDKSALETLNDFSSSLTGVQGIDGFKRSYGDLKNLLSGTTGEARATAFNGLLEQSLKGVQIEAQRSKIQLALMKNGMTLTAAGAKAAAESTSDFSKRVNQLNAVLSGRASLRDYKASIDDFSKSLRDNGKTLNINTAAGRANQASLDNIASTALRYAQTLGPLQRIQFMANARRQFIAAAVDAGKSRAAAQALADKVLGLNNVRGRPKIGANAGEANNVFSSVLKRLGIVDRATANPTISVKADLTGFYTVQKALNSLPGRVSTVARVKSGAYARGGWVSGPGGPREDKVPAWLSNREFVVNAASAQKYARELEWINAQGLANGGWAGMTTATPARVSVAAPTLVGASISGTMRINGNVATIEDARIVAQEEIAAFDDTSGMLARAGGR